MPSAFYPSGTGQSNFSRCPYVINLDAGRDVEFSDRSVNRALSDRSIKTSDFLNKQSRTLITLLASHV